MSIIRAERVWVQDGSINLSPRSTAIKIPTDGMWVGVPIVRLGLQCTMPDEQMLAEREKYRFSAQIKWGLLTAWGNGGGNVIYKIDNWISDPTNEPGGMPGGAVSLPGSAKGQYAWLEVFTGASVDENGIASILTLAADIIFDDGNS